jgi:hypothetical protein
VPALPAKAIKRSGQGDQGLEKSRDVFVSGNPKP